MITGAVSSVIPETIGPTIRFTVGCLRIRGCLIRVKEGFVRIVGQRGRVNRVNFKPAEQVFKTSEETICILILLLAVSCFIKV